LHIENLEQWLENDQGITLICELVKQGSLGFANE